MNLEEMKRIFLNDPTKFWGNIDKLIAVVEAAKKIYQPVPVTSGSATQEFLDVIYWNLKKALEALEQE